MITEQQKQELISALETERQRLRYKGVNTWNHDYAIHYLHTGEILGETRENEILEACVNDIDCLYNDYCS